MLHILVSFGTKRNIQSCIGENILTWSPYKPREFNFGSSGFCQKAEGLAPLRCFQITGIYWAPTQRTPGAGKAGAPEPHGGSQEASLKGGTWRGAEAQQLKKREEEFFQNLARGMPCALAWIQRRESGVFRDAGRSVLWSEMPEAGHGGGKTGSTWHLTHCYREPGL